jgi:3-dehydroquinate synthase
VQPVRYSLKFRPEYGVETTVLIGRNHIAELQDRLLAIAPGRWFCISSRPVLKAIGTTWLSGIPQALLDPEPILVPDGERAKTWQVLGRVLLELKKRGVRRDGGVLAVGGGTVGDLAGMAASLSLRGVPVVQVPTTLLAAADSSLGGKTAVDLGDAKNLAGTFHHPALVFADTQFLDRLPERDYRSGLAEVVKSALLDRGFWKRFPALAQGLAQRDPNAVSEAVYRSLKMKARVVKADPRETRGLRFALNLGHTLGHALEGASGFELRHGEAVAWGMLAALKLSEKRAGLSPATAGEAAGFIEGLVAPPSLPASSVEGWAALLPLDKKGDSSGVRAVLLEQPGQVRLERLDISEWRQAFESVRSRYNQR